MRLELEIRAAHQRTRETYGPERLKDSLDKNGVKTTVYRVNRFGYLSPAAFERQFYEKRLAA